MAENATGDQESAASPDAPPPTEGGATVSDIADMLASERPAVQQHVVDNARQEATETAAAAAENKDAAGTIFDATKHTGTKTTTGVWRAKKQKTGTVTASGSKLGTGTQSTASVVGASSASASKEAQARAGGKGAANLLLALSVGLGGPEWQPRRIVAEDKKTLLLDEKDMLESAFGDYFVATGKADLPPGWALTAACAMYALPRTQMPATQSRLQRAKAWLGSKVLAFRAKRAGLRIPRKNEKHEGDIDGQPRTA